LLEVFETWVEHPNKLTKKWAAAHGHVVADFVRRRGELANTSLSSMRGSRLRAVPRFESLAR
jgi:hypothetical protein